MKNLVVCGLVLLALALSCGATEPVQLSGADGQAILLQIAGTIQFISLSGNTGLWDLGGAPAGQTLNQSLQRVPSQQVLAIGYGGWLPGV